MDHYLAKRWRKHLRRTRDVWHKKRLIWMYLRGGHGSMKQFICHGTF